MPHAVCAAAAFVALCLGSALVLRAAAELALLALAAAWHAPA